MLAIVMPPYFNTKILDGTVIGTLNTLFKFSEYFVHLVERNVCSTKTNDVVIHRNGEASLVKRRTNLQRKRSMRRTKGIGAIKNRNSLSVFTCFCNLLCREWAEDARANYSNLLAFSAKFACLETSVTSARTQNNNDVTGVPATPSVNKISVDDL